MYDNLIKCQRCNLCQNQLPLIDKQITCDIMFVGLSAKKVDDPKINIPLAKDTDSGKIINEIEESLQQYKFYKTNLVKCLPLNESNKLRYPSKEEMNLCIENLFIEITTLQPKIIFLLGTKVSEFIIDYQKKHNIKINSKLIKVYHPSYIHVYQRHKKTEYIENIIKLIENNINK